MIKLTRSTGGTVWVNPRNILFVEKRNLKTMVKLIGEDLIVNECPDTIVSGIMVLGYEK